MSIMCYGENALHLRVKFMFCQKNKYGLFMIHYTFGAQVNGLQTL